MLMTTKYLKNLLNRMANPERQLKVIHIAGTNGKGSVCKMIEGVLIKLNRPEHLFKVATFMSPSPINDKNGICINNLRISDQDYEVCESIINKHINEMEQAGQTLPSEFEILVAIAICFFTMHHVDIAIIEVGMGGLNDATNVFDNPLLSIITSIDYDHMAFLGNTLESIAEQKAGIIKKNCTVILGDIPKDAKQVIIKTANKKNAPVIDLFKIPLDASSTLKYVQDNDAHHFMTQFITYEKDSENYPSKLLGNHQISNLYIAIHALKYLSTKYPEIISFIHNTGEIIWPCRQEYFYTSFEKQWRGFLIDGAHNNQSMDALIDTCKHYFNHKKIVIIFSAFKDKDIPTMLKKLSTISEELIITDIDHERATPLSDLQIMASEYFKNITIIPGDLSAISHAVHHKTSTLSLDDTKIQNLPGIAESYPDLILITGSLYLTVPLRNQLIPLIQSVY